MIAHKRRRLVTWSVEHPKSVVWGAVLLTILLALPIPRAVIDTDPENMLEHDEPVRLMHERIKEEFGLADYLVIGFTGETSLLTDEFTVKLSTLVDSIAEMEGVVADDIIAPSTVDDIYRRDDGALVVGPLTEPRMGVDGGQPSIEAKIVENPILRGKLASDDGRAVAVYVPLTAKKYAHSVADDSERIINQLGGLGRHHFTGLPVAEERFGIEMFRQMGISAPLAGALIFLLLLFFFRRFGVVTGPMIVAMMTVIWTMGMLIWMGFTVHIMSSMIAIFLMPIAVLDGIHILSEFHDRYQKAHSRKEAVLSTMNELFMPMLFTSVTTVVGFASLLTADIPPVRVFGAFVAFGVASAWFLTMTFLPAYAMILPARTLSGFGRRDEGASWLGRNMPRLGRFAVRNRSAILISTVALAVVSAYGITRIEVNDNPTKWFKASHPIRIAERELSAHLAGVYLAYLEFDATGTAAGSIQTPDGLKSMEGLQRHLEKLPQVGGTTGVTDIVKKVRIELKNGDSAYYAIPDNTDEIAQELFLYEAAGGDPDDLFKFINPSGDKAVLWVQLQDGDNQSVSAVVDAANDYMAGHPAAEGMVLDWAGLTYINVVWQEKMVIGMLNSLLSSFVVVWIMMIFLLRSFVLGLISMIPLSVTIGFVYGAIGLAGKPYDMPIAILSSLTLGLSIDFAIHFLKRGQEIFRETRDVSATLEELFGEPARAIARNIVVIALGFVPLLFSDLVPYVTVGAFFLAIMLFSGFSTLMVLPALTRLRGAKAFWWWGARDWLARHQAHKEETKEVPV